VDQQIPDPIGEQIGQADDDPPALPGDDVPLPSPRPAESPQPNARFQRWQLAAQTGDVDEPEEEGPVSVGNVDVGPLQKVRTTPIVTKRIPMANGFEITFLQLADRVS
jgi:hypothetical protein